MVPIVILAEFGNLTTQLLSTLRSPLSSHCSDRFEEYAWGSDRAGGLK
ncbi:MAG: hypothetical protein LRZ84_20680 [Desertifilum sp.]|nr:hypothetical protein [Desertifilum sp.]